MDEAIGNGGGVVLWDMLPSQPSILYFFYKTFKVTKENIVNGRVFFC